MSVETDVRFVHFWRFQAGALARPTQTIVLVKDYCAIEWSLRIIAPIQETFFGSRRNQLAGFQLQLEPSLRTWSIRTPKLKKCNFSLIVKKFTGEVVQGPHLYTTTANLEGQDISIRPPLSSQFHTSFQIAMNPDPDAYVELTTTFVVPSSSFGIGSWPNAAPPPQINEFPFRIVENKQKHNVKIICQGGVYTANRAALFQCSGYFRKLFNDHKEETEFTEDVPIQAAEIVFTFMLTATFSPRFFMTPSLVNDVVSLIRRYSVLGAKELVQALERESCFQMIKDELILEKVLQWMIVGSDHDMLRLENVAHAILFLQHSNHMMVEYTGNAPGNAERREIFEKLHARRSLFNQSPISRLTSQRNNSLLPFEFVAV